MIPGGRSLLPALLALALPALAEGLPDTFLANRKPWEDSLAKGAAAPVRKAAETLLAAQGPAVNPSDYSGMHAMVAVMGYAARACVLEGDWEQAVAHLTKASQLAAENAATAMPVLAKVRREHDENLRSWRAETDKLEQRLTGLDAASGLNSEQIRQRTAVRSRLDELRNAIALTEKMVADADSNTTILEKEKADYAASAAQWQAFLAQEQADIQRKGSAKAYVEEKYEQVKGDDAKPVATRLAFARRLVHLDSSNPDCRRLVSALSGEEEPAPKPAPKAKAKAKAQKKRRKGH